MHVSAYPECSKNWNIEVLLISVITHFLVARPNYSCSYCY